MMLAKPESFTRDGEHWKRMRFKGNKVYVQVDDEGRPEARDGKVRICYRHDDTREYSATANRIRALDDLTPDETPSRPRKKARPAARGGPAASEGERALEDLEAIVVYTDGACSGNPGPAGIGVLLRYMGREKEISESIGQATNNVAELKAVQAGLRAIRNRKLPVILYTDSEYVRGLLIKGWKAKKNTELVEKLRALARTFPDLTIRWVEGHAGNEDNERVDKLARKGLRKKPGGGHR
jgi:ribonuclease HI